MASYAISINVLVLILVWVDRAASRGRITPYRVPERVFHTLSLFGGAAAMLLGQFLCCHTKLRPEFLRFFFMVAIVQIPLFFALYLALMLSPKGITSDVLGAL